MPSYLKTQIAARFQSHFITSVILAIVCLLVAWPMNVFAAVQARAVRPASVGKTLVTSQRNTLGTETNRSASVRLGDVDGDGDLDAVVANGRHWPQQNYLFFNQGGSQFTVMRPLGCLLYTSPSPRD